LIKISKAELKQIIVEEMERFQDEIESMCFNESKKTQRRTKLKKKVKFARDKETEREETENEKKDRLFYGYDELRKLGSGIAREANCSGRNRDQDGYFSDETTTGSHASDSTCPDEPSTKKARSGSSRSTPKVLPCGCKVNDTEGCKKRHPHACKDGSKYSDNELNESEKDQFAQYVAGLVSQEIKKLLKQLQQQKKNNQGAGCSLSDLDALSRASKGSLHKKPK